MEAFPLPEMGRIPLDDVVLQVLVLRLGHPASFLLRCLAPPGGSQLRASVLSLLDIGAITAGASARDSAAAEGGGGAGAGAQGLPPLELTALGVHLAKMPVDARLGKMLIMGCLLHCPEPVLTVAAALGGKSPFSAPPNKQDEAKRAWRSLVGGSDPEHTDFCSDHLAVVRAFDGWVAASGTAKKPDSNAARAFARRYWLNEQALQVCWASQAIHTLLFRSQDPNPYPNPNPSTVCLSTCLSANRKLPPFVRLSGTICARLASFSGFVVATLRLTAMARHGPEPPPPPTLTTTTPTSRRNPKNRLSL
jgi:HrpA-like RNA helicase